LSREVELGIIRELAGVGHIVADMLSSSSLPACSFQGTPHLHAAAVPPGRANGEIELDVAVQHHRRGTTGGEVGDVNGMSQPAAAIRQVGWAVTKHGEQAIMAAQKGVAEWFMESGGRSTRGDMETASFSMSAATSNNEEVAHGGRVGN
jgi:hypothetical protein